MICTRSPPSTETTAAAACCKCPTKPSLTTSDYTRAQEQLAGLPGKVLPVFTYPFGAYSELSERVLQALGVQVTVTTEGGANRLVKGEPETLRLLRRIHVWHGTKPDMLLSRIDAALQTLR